MGKILGVSKVTRKFQVTIPKTVRVLLEIQEGDLVVFELTEDGKIILRKS